MAIRSTTALIKGLLLGSSFLGVLLIIFSPVFGNGKNGLEYADDMFNKLAKGSSYFIPKVQKDAARYAGREFAVSVTVQKQEERTAAILLLAQAGLQTENEEGGLRISGDFGKLLMAALNDADQAFWNRDSMIASRYGEGVQTVLPSWWQLLKSMDKALTKEKKYAEASMVTMVMKKAIEPAYNFLGIEAQNVSERAGILTGLLVFYVVYTIWWGFAVYYLFEAVGLVMRKARKKEEI